LASVRSRTLAPLPGTDSQKQSAKLRHKHFLRNFEKNIFIHRILELWLIFLSLLLSLWTLNHDDDDAEDEAGEVDSLT